MPNQNLLFKSTGVGLAERLVRRVRIAHRLVDIATITTAGAIAWWLRFGTFDMSGHHYLAAVFVIGSAALILPLAGAYSTLRSHRYWKALSQALLGWTLAIGLAATVAYLTKTGEMFSRLWIGYWWLGGLAILPITRFALAKISQRLSTSKHYREGAILVGQGPLMQKLLDTFSGNTYSGVTTVAIFATDGNTSDAPGILQINNITELESLLDPLNPSDSIKEGAHIDQLWLVGQSLSPDLTKKLIDVASHNAVRVIFAPDLPLAYDHPWAQAYNLNGMPVIDLSPAPSSLNRTTKRMFDLAIAIPGLIICAPLFAIIAIAIRLESQGPIFYRQERLTRHGRAFTIFKFRSMYSTEDSRKITQATKGDDRITKVGKILRQTSLDEIPQLLNVLKGEMSAVGPRPHAHLHSDTYRNMIPGYMYRHLVKAGMTGLAQVQGLRGETSNPEQMRLRVIEDTNYINNWSPLLDLRILMKTFWIVVTGKNAW